MFSTTLICGNDDTRQFYRNGTLDKARFNKIASITMHKDGGILVCDEWNECIRLIDRKSNKVTTFAGSKSQSGFRNGPKEQARFYHPSCCIFTPDGKILLVGDSWNSCIRSIDMRTKNVSTFAGIPEIHKLIFSPDGTTLLICRFDNNCLFRSICMQTGEVSNFLDETSIVCNVTDCIFSPDGKVLILFTKKRYFYTYNIETKSINAIDILVSDGALTSGIFTINGELLLFDTLSNCIVSLDLQTKITTVIAGIRKKKNDIFCVDREKNCVRLIHTDKKEVSFIPLHKSYPKRRHQCREQLLTFTELRTGIMDNKDLLICDKNSIKIIKNYI